MVMLFPTKNLPQELTSYDLLKSFAVVTMIIDHIGAYVFPEYNDLRAIGRASMPVWLFLIGYARSRDLSSLLWIGGFILVLSDIVIGKSLFATNILFTILFVRMSLDVVMQLFFRDRESVFLITFSMVILVFPTDLFFEYGTHAFLFAMFGYLVRHKKELSIPNIYILTFMGVAVVAHSFFQQFMFDFNEREAVLASAGIFLICLYMTNFSPKLYPVLTSKLPFLVTGPIQLMGRYSLEIYVLHLLILKAIAFPMFPERFGWFQWSWF